MVINKYTTQWKETSTRVLIEGKAILVSLKWHRENQVNILAIYAPTGSGNENADFWTDLKEKFETDQTLPKVDIMLGDCNMVEMELDRSPMHADPQRTVNTMSKLRDKLNLADGWRLENPTGKEFTFSTKKRNEVNSWSRIDRMYVNYDILEKSREWRTADPGFETDHRVVIAQISPKGTPWVGKGRSTVPDYIVKYKKPAQELLKLLRKFDEDLKPMIEHKSHGVRDASDNIQT